MVDGLNFDNEFSDLFNDVKLNSKFIKCEIIYKKFYFKLAQLTCFYFIKFRNNKEKK